MTALATTGSTIKSDTYEGAIDELCSIILIAQKLISSNPDNVLAVSTSTDSISGQITYSLNIPLESQSTTGGGMSFSVTNPFVISPWITGGDITAANPLQQLFNLIVQLETYEGVAARNPGNETRLQVDIQSAPWRCVAGLTLNSVFSLNSNGSLSRTVQTYLV